MAEEDLDRMSVLLSSIRHPNILPIHESFLWDSNQYLVVVTEHCCEANLGDLVESSSINLEELMADVAEGLQYLHNEKRTLL